MNVQLFFLLSALLIDWPQFRGANSDGHADGPVTIRTWSDTENVVWKVPLPGLGWSSPSIVDGRLFLTTAVPDGDGLSLRALALDVASGEVLWSQEIVALADAPAIHSKNSHASPTPLVHEGAVYVHFGTNGTAKLSAADGSLIWLNQGLVYNPVHGCGGSPALHDGKLVVICDGNPETFVACLDAETGNELWRTPRSVPARISHSFGTPVVTEVDGRPQVIAPGPDHLAAYDLETGEEQWKILSVGWSVVPQPIITDGMVIYNHDYERPELIAAKLGGSGDVTETNVVWRLKRGAPSTPTPVLVGEELYVVSDGGVASCVDVRTGEVHWTEHLGGNFSASPIYADGQVLFLDEDGRSTWVEASTEFKVLGSCEVPGRTLATPTFTGGFIYLRTDSALYKFGPTSESR